MKPQTIDQSDVDLFDESFRADPYPFYRRLRDEYPIARYSPVGAFLVTRHADVGALIRDHSRVVMPTHDGRRATGRTHAMMTGKEHTQHRAYFAKEVRARSALATLEPIVQQIAIDLVEDLAGRASVDLVADFSWELPSRVVAHLLGMEGEQDQLVRWDHALLNYNDAADVVTDPNLIDEAIARAGNAARQEIQSRFRPIVEEKTSNSDSDHDFIGHLIHARAGDQPLSVDEIISNIALLILGGIGNTASSMQTMLAHCLPNQELMATLRKDRRQISPLFDEALRFDAPAQLVRRVTLEEVEVDGAVIPSGAQLMLFLGSANRDERAFAQPDSFIPDRFDGRATAGESKHFGFGVPGAMHYCVGSELARLEATVGVATLLDRVPKIEVKAENRLSAQGIGPVGWKHRSMKSLLVELSGAGQV